MYQSGEPWPSQRAKRVEVSVVRAGNATGLVVFVEMLPCEQHLGRWGCLSLGREEASMSLEREYSGE
ncbi:hypothetical protein H9L39_16946 [Fusarium oxysporum f. sp. albedinis]|nr:hypothetical protein H9L39_16946 [Fusarium oxysporum f. sp. albedinis]